MVQFPRKIIHYQKTALLTVFHVFHEGNEKLKTGKRSRASFQFEHLIIKFKCMNTLAKTEIIYPKNVGASVAMNFT